MKPLGYYEYERDLVIELKDGTVIFCDGDVFVTFEEGELDIKPNRRTTEWPWPFHDEKGLPITSFFVTPSEVKYIDYYSNYKKRTSE